VVVGPPLFVGGDQLAVQDRRMADLGVQRGHLGQQVGDVLEAAILQAYPALRIDEKEAAQAVPFDLEQVVVGRERGLGGNRLHRPDGGRKGVQLEEKLVGALHAS